jgi:hypothetical protein
MLRATVLENLIWLIPLKLGKVDQVCDGLKRIVDLALLQTSGLHGVIRIRFRCRSFGAALDPAVSVHAQLAVKDEYTFAFLDLEDAHSERELERALTRRVEAFLQEMGNMFTFVGSQHKIQVGEREFFIDLLLYHRRLQALVALELKIGEFEPEYIGKMQFYLSVLDDTVRLPEEQPSIGIILCKSKDRLIVEYALKDATLPIGVSSYSVTPNVPIRLQGQLPSADQIASLLAGID